MIETALWSPDSTKTQWVFWLLIIISVQLDQRSSIYTIQSRCLGLRLSKSRSKTVKRRNSFRFASAAFKTLIAEFAGALTTSNQVRLFRRAFENLDATLLVAQVGNDDVFHR